MYAGPSIIIKKIVVHSIQSTTQFVLMFDQLEGCIWIDGCIIPWREAKVHLMTHALHYGTSVYDGLRSYHNSVLHGIPHYERFLRSAQLLDFTIPYDARTLLDATQQLLHQGKYTFGYIRALAWCGSQSMLVSHRFANVHTAIMIWERPMPYSAKQYMEGLKLHLSSWQRPHPKSAPVHSKAAGLYMISAMAKRTAELNGFDDALLLDTQNRIAEASSSNIFFVRDGKLETPIPHSFLKGLTRAFVIESALAEGIEVLEKDFYLPHFEDVEEVFLTGTAVGIVPVASIQTEDKLYQFRPGTITRAIQKLYEDALPTCEKKGS